MLIKKASDLRSSEITDQKLYLGRREFLRTAAGVAAAGASILAASGVVSAAGRAAPHGPKLPNVVPSPLSLTPAQEKPNTWEQITTYNNYYEFGSPGDMEEPSLSVGKFKTDPWTITIEGECAKKGSFPIEELLKGLPVEERIYRHRCVEAWSMVIPWAGVPLAQLIKRCEPTSKARFVEFTTYYNASMMPGVQSQILAWPYREGLRMDEAMHPLAILATGLYGEALPKQDGAPMKLVVPWKYGFKGAKSIAKIRFAETQPLNTWQQKNAREYGFYSNVNPTVDHPRWSQSSERRIGEFFMRKTLMFNGYADQVQSMYAGMDLKKNF